MPRPPKDLTKYIPSLVAGIRLIDLALQQILCRKKARVRWQLKLWLYYPEGSLDPKTVVVPSGGTFNSGEYSE